LDTQEIDEPIVAVEDCDQFICFFDSGATGDEERDRYPVGFGKTRGEAFKMGLTHVMPDVAKLGVYGMAQSGFITIAQPNLSADEFAALGEIVTDFFTKRDTLQRTEPE
jgi:hypothetical protein